MATGQQGPPTRPWFRLATMVRPPPSAAPAPQPAQAPPSRPTIITRPELALRPSQPPVVARATSPPITSSPPQTEQIIPSSAHRTTTTISNSPSPLALPSPQLKYSNQETKVDNNDNSRRSLDNRTKTTINKLHPEDVVGNGMTRRIIIAGENKGAIMDVSSDKSAASDTDNYYSKKSNISRNNNNYIKPLMGAVVNSNVQGVNNSILYNSSTTHHDPGLHLSLSRKNASSSSGRGN